MFFAALVVAIQFVRKRQGSDQQRGVMAMISNTCIVKTVHKLGVSVQQSVRKERVLLKTFSVWNNLCTHGVAEKNVSLDM